MSRRLPGAWILQAATEASRLPRPRQGAGRRSDRPEVLRAAATAPDRFVPGARQLRDIARDSPATWTARCDVPRGARHLTPLVPSGWEAPAGWCLAPGGTSRRRPSGPDHELAR